MKQGAYLRVAVIMAGVVAWAAVTFGTVPLPLRVGLSILAVASAGYWIRLDRRSGEANKHNHVLKMLNHHRHDWMNELQVLFGYVRLKKYDRLPDYMDKMRTRALQDGFLAKLGYPALIVYLLDKRIEGGGCSVEVELEQEIDLRQVRLEEQELYQIITGIADSFLMYGGQDLGDPRALSIGFDRDGDELLVDFVYQGEAQWDNLHKALRSVLDRWDNKLTVREEEFGEGQAVLALALPFRTY